MEEIAIQLRLAKNKASKSQKTKHFIHIFRKKHPQIRRRLSVRLIPLNITSKVPIFSLDKTKKKRKMKKLNLSSTITQ